jgi:hypothetical protein
LCTLGVDIFTFFFSVLLFEQAKKYGVKQMQADITKASF